jgi:hypothetical protein
LAQAAEALKQRTIIPLRFQESTTNYDFVVFRKQAL